MLERNEFSFTVALSGLFDYTYRQNYSNKTSSNNPLTATGNGSFTLKDGEYLKITSSRVDSGSGTWKPSLTTTIEKYDANGVKQSTSTLTWTSSNDVNANNGAYRSFNFHDLSYTVTETDYSAAPHYYDTALTCRTLRDGYCPGRIPKRAAESFSPTPGRRRTSR